MTDCALCTYPAYKEAIIYEDDAFIIAAHPFPLVEHELIVYPKKHVPILEELDPILLERFFLLAAQAAVLLYETFKPAGTTILLENGPAAGQFIPHISMSIIPRQDGDGLLTWQPGTLPMDRLKLLQQQLSEALQQILASPVRTGQVVKDGSGSPAEMMSPPSPPPSLSPPIESPPQTRAPHPSSPSQKGTPHSHAESLPHSSPQDSPLDAKGSASEKEGEKDSVDQEDAFDYALENYMRRNVP